eukprot:TRINITY_DN72015_c0_g1_i1.p3 TRINITY_DN72015_c0_g1~~TRINITY_DN72015_c0_g1_i1.p3  ORF type:complete len:113 (-),score=1.62 TRINITY_DN72015_c0_g1_i1:7-345(-)
MDVQDQKRCVTKKQYQQTIHSQFFTQIIKHYFILMVYLHISMQINQIVDNNDNFAQQNESVVTIERNLVLTKEILELTTDLQFMAVVFGNIFCLGMGHFFKQQQNYKQCFDR